MLLISNCTLIREVRVKIRKSQKNIISFSHPITYFWPLIKIIRNSNANSKWICNILYMAYWIQDDYKILPKNSILVSVNRVTYLSFVTRNVKEMSRERHLQWARQFQSCFIFSVDYYVKKVENRLASQCTKIFSMISETDFSLNKDMH